MIGILGGTFNPIHLGHIRVAELALECGICPIHFVPAYMPPHRAQPDISTEDRIAMVQLAIEGNPSFLLDLEIPPTSLPGPSYMVETLKLFRDTYGPTQPLALLIGADSLNQLTTWHQWPDLFKYAHVIAFSRPGHLLELPEALKPYLISEMAPCLSTPSGFLYYYSCDTFPHSSTEIREAFKSHSEELKNLLPLKVYDYIKEHSLF